MTCLNLSWCLRPDIQVSVSAIMSKGSRSNNDACVGFSHFVRRFRISVQGCMLGGEDNILPGAGASSGAGAGPGVGSLVCPHPVSLGESRGQFFCVFRICEDFL